MAAVQAQIAHKNLVPHAYVSSQPGAYKGLPSLEDLPAMTVLKENKNGTYSSNWHMQYKSYEYIIFKW